MTIQLLNLNGKKMCSLCFSQLDLNNHCNNCDGHSNKTKYPMVLKENTILLGKYSVGKVLGKGGFGITYLCYDLSAGKKVAIKEFFPNSIVCRTDNKNTVYSIDSGNTGIFSSYSQKFYEEASLVSTFSGHPNVVSVYEFFYENSTAYFVMEALEGMDLKNYIKSKGGKISENEAVYIIDTVLNALSVIHASNVLHRDISPDNIYMCNDGNIKLIDFGAARQVIGEESKSLSIILKQGFAPLEQYQKNGVQGPWTDIYALGATLYHAITGKLIDDAMSRLDNDSLDLTGISDGLGQVITKMLNVRHVDRFQNVQDVRDAIKALNINMIQPKSVSYCCDCGKPIPYGSKHCDACLAKKTASTNNWQANSTPVQNKWGPTSSSTPSYKTSTANTIFKDAGFVPQPKNYTKPLIWLGGAVGVIILIICISTWMIPIFEYNKGMTAYNNGDYEEAYLYFKDLDYKDSDVMGNKCIYSQAEELLHDKRYDEAADLFRSIPDYRDASNMALKCVYSNATDKLNSGNYEKAKEIFETIPNYADSKDMILECDYKKAEDALNVGKYIEAMKIFNSIKDHKNSYQMFTEVENQLLSLNRQNGYFQDDYSMLGEWTDSIGNYVHYTKQSNGTAHASYNLPNEIGEYFKITNGIHYHGSPSGGWKKQWIFHRVTSSIVEVYDYINGQTYTLTKK